MSFTYEQLTELLKKAQQDPWTFFEGNSLKELQIASHPDRLRRESDLFEKFGAAYARSQKPLIKMGGFPLYEQVALGDLREIFRSTANKIVKIPRTKGKAVDKLVKREEDLLSFFEKESEGTSYGKYFPSLISCFDDDGRKCIVTDYDQKLYTVQQIGKVEGRHIGWMLKRMLTVLGYIHIKGYCHCAVTPEHVMFAPENHAGVLTGWIHSHKIGESLDVVPLVRKDWYKLKVATPALDINMLGKTAATLIGTDVPAKIRNFIKALRFPSIGVDAWTLEEDFTAILKECYGPPKFVPLIVEV